MLKQELKSHISLIDNNLSATDFVFVRRRTEHAVFGDLLTSFAHPLHLAAGPLQVERPELKLCFLVYRGQLESELSVTPVN